MAGNVFRALGDPTRRKIINRLRMGPKSVAEIARAMKVSRPAVSQGLKIMLRARLVKPQIQGRQTFYSLDRRGLDEARTYLEAWRTWRRSTATDLPVRRLVSISLPVAAAGVRLGGRQRSARRVFC
jgi:DNA-binding transcriptional ArsR family regulator